MKRLWVAAALAPLMFAAVAHADTTISNGTTTPVSTATVNGGSPDNIIIGSGGSVNPTSGAAVTLNSSNNVTNNGTIQIQNQSNSTGILAVVPSGGLTGSIANAGAITVNSTTSPTVNGTTGIANGPFANITTNYGIHVTGAGLLTGSIGNAGTITVTGDNSAGIQVESGGLSGGIANTGTITVLGGEPAGGPSYGIHTVGAIGGAVSIQGAISATGVGARGIALDGGAGSVDINNAVTSTGFRSLTAPTDPTLIAALTADQLQANGPAVSIGGSVPGGITVDSALFTAGVATTTGGVITSQGPAPALLIGGPNAVTIGANPTNGAGLFIGGTVSGQGIYQNFNATGVQVGTGAAPVNITGGIALAGSVNVSTVATSLSSSLGQGMSTGIRVRPQASVGIINVGGSLSVGSTSTVANTVTGILIDNGASVGTIIVGGTVSTEITGIGATLNGPAASGGTAGNVTAVSDLSGTVSSVVNTGNISATIVPIVPGSVVTGTAVALDLSHNTTGETVTQNANSNAAITPSITGNVLLGSGPSTLDLEAGTLNGGVSFGVSPLNQLILNNGAQMTGALSSASSGAIAANINSGQLSMTQPNAIPMSTLHIGSAGQVIFAIDPAAGTNSVFNVAGAATLDSGAKIGLNFLSPLATETSYTLITAGNLTASAINQSLEGQIPYLLEATVVTNTGVNGSVVVNAGRRSAADAGFNPAETSAYNAIFAAFSQDSAVSADLLSKTNRSDFIHLYDQFLPDYAGGAFDTLVVGQGDIARAEADAPVKLQGEEARGWVQEIGYLDNRQDTGQANGYRAGGFGIVGGMERARGDSAVGVSAAFITDGVKDDRQALGANLSSAALEVGVYWRYGVGDGLNLHASVNGGYVLLSNQRLLYDEDSTGTTTLFRQAKSSWNGAIGSAELGASYQMAMGRFYLRPEASLDYILLYESAFAEHGGGAAMDLAVASRLNEEATAQADMVLGLDFGTAIHWRPELTLGWRQIVAGGPGDTKAQFVSGPTSFTLTPQLQDRGGLLARLGVRAGGAFADFSADAGGEFNKDYQTYDARAVARFLF
jgi:hypothetical protein